MTDNDADNYAAMQMTFVNDVTDYDADADNADDFADDGRQHRQWMTMKTTDKDAYNR